jgi:phosphoribosylformylglycinamidine cyclo-ligase
VRSRRFVEPASQPKDGVRLKPDPSGFSGLGPYTRAVKRGNQTYAAAGVSIEKADAVVERLRAAVESTGATGFGGFAGLHPLDGSRLLAASTDSVGTKLILARQRGALRSCGADLAAHCINDVLTSGAEPLFFLDYVAANRIDLEQVAALVEGAAEVCREAGCALVGGETAELPGIYREEELDFAGTCVGIVERERLIDGVRIEAGDAVIGFESAGVHANGFTLVRRVLEAEDYDGGDLLAPTRLYLDAVRRLREHADVRGLAHVTGGGILGNLARVLPEGLRAEIDWDSWTRPPVFGWLAGHVEEAELRRVFNLGIGFLAVVPDPGDAHVIGTVVPA